jgi:hypothetical protein
MAGTPCKASGTLPYVVDSGPGWRGSGSGGGWWVPGYLRVVGVSGALTS